MRYRFIVPMNARAFSGGRVALDGFPQILIQRQAGVKRADLGLNRVRARLAAQEWWRRFPDARTTFIA